MKPFGVEEVRMLLEVEGQMDRKEIPFVVVHGGRAAMEEELMEALGLVSGQVVPDALWLHILRLKLALCEEQIAKQRTVALVQEVLP